jgi:multiple sugar transport system permease protein
MASLPRIAVTICSVCRILPGIPNGSAEWDVAFAFLSSAANKSFTGVRYNFARAYAPQWPLLMAASLWAILPVVMLFSVIEGRLAEGLTAGAVK